MVDELLHFKKSVQIAEDDNVDDVNVTSAIELKEMWEHNDKVTIKLQIDGENIKEIEIRRRWFCVRK